LFLSESDSESDLGFLRQDSELNFDIDFLDLDLDFDKDQERLGKLDAASSPSLPFFPLPCRLLWESESDTSSDLSDNLLLDLLRGFFASRWVLSGEENLP
jgi:hypothetical protein